MLFIRIINWLLLYFKNITFATLAGFVTGSLIYIWPWQTKTEHTKLIDNLSYPTFENNTDLYSILLILMGILSILLIEKIAKKNKDV